MSDRVSETILLCEDDPQEQLVRYYLKECRLDTREPLFRSRNASREVAGGNVHWVLREFAKELKVCRKRHKSHAKTLLIVVVDADDFTVEERRRHLSADPPISEADPLVVLIPRRHIETWIHAAAGVDVDETTDYKTRGLTKSHVRAAARIIRGWAQGSPPPGATCPQSLLASLTEWRRIG